MTRPDPHTETTIAITTMVVAAACVAILAAAIILCGCAAPAASSAQDTRQALDPRQTQAPSATAGDGSAVSITATSAQHTHQRSDQRTTQDASRGGGRQSIDVGAGATITTHSASSTRDIIDHSLGGNWLALLTASRSSLLLWAGVMLTIIASALIYALHSAPPGSCAENIIWRSLAMLAGLGALAYALLRTV